MKAELRSIFSTDVENLAGWRSDAADFSLPIRLFVGPAGGEGEESFDLTLSTGGWLANVAREIGVVDPRHHLVVDHFDWTEIRHYIQRRIDECTGATWTEVAEQLARFAHWEFEDYP